MDITKHYESNCSLLYPSSLKRGTMRNPRDIQSPPKQRIAICIQNKFMYCKHELPKCFIFSVTAICKKPLSHFLRVKKKIYNFSPHLEGGDFSINSQTSNAPQELGQTNDNVHLPFHGLLQSNVSKKSNMII